MRGEYNGLGLRKAQLTDGLILLVEVEDEGCS